VEEVLRTVLFDRMRKDGRDPAQLNCAAEIVVFGSYAAGLSRADSDIDVLCVGNGLRLKSRSLDLSWVSEDNLSEDAWLGSELAGHIAKYGIWLRGDGRWRATVFGGAPAIDRKRKRIISLSRTVSHFWDRLHPIFQDQYGITIRRELQRLAMLEAQVQVPPTKVLDDEWCRNGNHGLLEVRSSISELRAYEGHSKVPMILRLSS
jgi:predicted nucleotidyltransferase